MLRLSWQSAVSDGLARLLAEPHVNTWKVHWDALDEIDFSDQWSCEFWLLTASSTQLMRRLVPSRLTVKRASSALPFWPPPPKPNRRKVPLREFHPDGPGDGPGRGIGED